MKVYKLMRDYPGDRYRVELDQGRDYASDEALVEVCEFTTPEGFTVAESAGGVWYAYDAQGTPWEAALTDDGEIVLVHAQMVGDEAQDALQVTLEPMTDGMQE